MVIQDIPAPISLLFGIYILGSGYLALKTMITAKDFLEIHNNHFLSTL